MLEGKRFKALKFVWLAAGSVSLEPLSNFQSSSPTACTGLLICPACSYQACGIIYDNGQVEKMKDPVKMSEGMETVQLLTS